MVRQPVGWDVGACFFVSRDDEEEDGGGDDGDDGGDDWNDGCDSGDDDVDGHGDEMIMMVIVRMTRIVIVTMIIMTVI